MCMFAYIVCQHVFWEQVGVLCLLSPFVPLYSRGFYLSFERHLRKCMPAVKAWFILRCICTVWFCNVHFGIKSASLHLYEGSFFFLRSWFFHCVFFCINCISGFSVYVKVCLIFVIKENITYVYKALQGYVLTHKDFKIKKVQEEKRRKNSCGHTLLSSSPICADIDLGKIRVDIVL